MHAGVIWDLLGNEKVISIGDFASRRRPQRAGWANRNQAMKGSVISSGTVLRALKESRFLLAQATFIDFVGAPGRNWKFYPNCPDGMCAKYSKKTVSESHWCEL